MGLYHWIQLDQYFNATNFTPSVLEYGDIFDDVTDSHGEFSWTSGSIQMNDFG